MLPTNYIPKDLPDEGRIETQIRGTNQAPSKYHKRCENTLKKLFLGNDDTLVEALMGLGKSYGTIKVASTTGKPVTIFTGRGHEEQYQQYEQWCDEFGLVFRRLPSFTHDCPTARGTNGEGWKETVLNWYHRGVPSRKIHSYGNPPCQQNGKCNYMAAWDFDPTQYDVITGHYAHAYVSKATDSRIVVIDEFPERAFIDTIENPSSILTHFLQEYSGPFTDFTGLIEGRHQSGKKRLALNHLEAHFPIFDDQSHEVISDTTGKAHAYAPFLTTALLSMQDLMNGWEVASLGDMTVVRNRKMNTIHVLSPPNLSDAQNVLALDGTPSWWLWNLVLGRLHGDDDLLHHRKVLTTNERRRYLRNYCGLHIVQTTPDAKTYSGGNYVSPTEDEALLQEIARKHGTKPWLITTKAAKSKYKRRGILTEYVDEAEHYGNIKGSNSFSTAPLGAVIGSQHYGDEYLEMWGAFSFETVTRTGGKGMNLSYSGIGDKILRHMREQETLQAVMRFGRDGNGATVYVHTAAIPNWVPVAHGPDDCRIQTWTTKQREVIEALSELGRGRTSEIMDHHSVSYESQRGVRNCLNKLKEMEVVSRTDEGSGYVWGSCGDAGVPIHVELPL